MRTKCIIFGKALRIGLKKIKQNLARNYSKSTKIAITACKLKKNFREAYPRTPLEPFSFLNQLQISSAEKNTLEKMWKLCPPPFQSFLLRHKQYGVFVTWPRCKLAEYLLLRHSRQAKLLLGLHFSFLVPLLTLFKLREDEMKSTYRLSFKFERSSAPPSMSYILRNVVEMMVCISFAQKDLFSKVCFQIPAFYFALIFNTNLSIFRYFKYQRCHA